MCYNNQDHFKGKPTVAVGKSLFFHCISVFIFFSWDCFTSATKTLGSEPKIFETANCASGVPCIKAKVLLLKDLRLKWDQSRMEGRCVCTWADKTGQYNGYWVLEMSLFWPGVQFLPIVPTCVQIFLWVERICCHPVCWLNYLEAMALISCSGF